MAKKTYKTIYANTVLNEDGVIPVEGKSGFYEAEEGVMPKRLIDSVVVEVAEKKEKPTPEKSEK
ncbi:MAG: hypothetical protein WCP97_00550 [bacterium]